MNREALGRGRRDEKMQVMVNSEEMAVFESWRKASGIEIRAEALRTLVARGLELAGDKFQGADRQDRHRRP